MLRCSVSSDERELDVLAALERELGSDRQLAELCASMGDRPAGSPGHPSLSSARRLGRSLATVTLLGAGTALGFTSHYTWLLLAGASLAWAVPELAQCLRPGQEATRG